MHRSRWYIRSRSLAAQVIAVAIVAELIRACVVEFPVALAGTALGAVLYAGNWLDWRRSDRALHESLQRRRACDGAWLATVDVGLKRPQNGPL